MPLIHKDGLIFESEKSLMEYEKRMKKIDKFFDDMSIEEFEELVERNGMKE